MCAVNLLPLQQSFLIFFLGAESDWETDWERTKLCEWELVAGEEFERSERWKGENERFHSMIPCVFLTS